MFFRDELLWWSWRRPFRLNLGPGAGGSIWTLLTSIIIAGWLVCSGFSYKLSYQERKKATRGFRGKELLGFDGHGKVYEGTLLNCNTQVAVKRFFHESKQGLREFSTEISGIGHLHHKNLVCMLGWSCRRGDPLPVYDFMPSALPWRMGANCDS